MIQMLLAALIFAIVTTIIIVPFMHKNDDKAMTNKSFTIFIIGIVVISFIASFIVIYLSKIDLNWTVLVYVLPILAIIGAMLGRGLERKIKLFFTLISVILLGYLLSAPIWNADTKYDSAQMLQAKEITVFDENETPASVPPKFAKNKMKKAFSQVPNTSFYELGNLQIQKIADDYVYVAPVEFSGLFKWLKGDTTPGYFVMSATDSTDNPKFMKYEMKYVPSAYFNSKLERYLRLQFPTLIFKGEPQLEVDDDGKPYYIRSYGKFISARDGFDVEGIVIVDALTGETQKLTLAEVPAFIDGAVSPEAVSLQNSYYGNYIHGFWNSHFGKKDVKLPSDEGTESNVSPIFMEDGVMFYFTDFTSPKEGVDSMLGYSLTNARTGEATYYTGNIEESYMDSRGALEIIEKKFIEKEWEGEMPILYNFYGEASWLASVLDSNGFLQNYFIVSAANPEVSAYASTPNEALKLYKTALSRGGATVDGSSNAKEATVKGVVERVHKERVGDATFVYFLLATGESFLASSESLPLVIYLEPGDEITVTYLATDEAFLPVRNITGGIFK